MRSSSSVCGSIWGPGSVFSGNEFVELLPETMLLFQELLGPLDRARIHETPVVYAPSKVVVILCDWSVAPVASALVSQGAIEFGEASSLSLVV